MKRTFCDDIRWSSILSQLSSVADLDATARAFGAFQRRGRVADAEGLLRLALMYGPGGLSLRGTAAAAEGIVGTLSDKAVEGRLRKAGAWLEHLLECLLRERGGAVAAGGLSLIDGTVIKPPGSGGQWRIHARYNPGQGRFVDLHLSQLSTAEAVTHTLPGPGQTVITDRGYARVRNIAAVLAQDCHFVTRIGWRSLPLVQADGRAFDLIAALPRGAAAVEHEVYVKGVERPLRVILQRLPDDKITRAAKRAIRKSSKNGTTVDPRTLQTAHYMMLLTSLPAHEQPAAQVIALYGARWQVELGFKRLKSLGGLDKLPSADPRLARTWLLAHLIVAVLTDDLAQEIVGVPPWTGRQDVCVSLAGLGLGASPAASSHFPREKKAWRADESPNQKKAF